MACHIGRTDASCLCIPVSPHFGHRRKFTTNSCKSRNNRTAIVVAVAAAIIAASSSQNGRAAALEVSGETKPGFAFPWSGAMYFPSSVPMQLADLSSRSELLLRTRGDGCRYAIMLFHGTQQMPSMQTFEAGAEQSASI